MFDRDQIDDVLSAMAESLDGDWLLVGGALVALWLEPRRVTEDIDIMGLESTQEMRLRLMRFAEDHELPIEAVNSAVDYFVQQIPGWQDEIEIFREVGGTRIFRPSPTLFLLLKIGRLSQQDLEDCSRLLDRVEEEDLALDIERVLRSLDRSSPAADEGVESRRRRLRKRLCR